MPPDHSRERRPAPRPDGAPDDISPTSASRVVPDATRRRAPWGPEVCLDTPYSSVGITAVLPVARRWLVNEAGDPAPILAWVIESSGAVYALIEPGDGHPPIVVSTWGLKVLDYDPGSGF